MNPYLTSKSTSNRQVISYYVLIVSISGEVAIALMAVVSYITNHSLTTNH